jgi:replicative DNA helicase
MIDQLPDMERQLLGNVFNRGEDFHSVAEIIRNYSFSSPDLQAAWRAMCDCAAAGEEINVVTLMARGVRSDVCADLDSVGIQTGVHTLARVIAEEEAARMTAATLAVIADDARMVNHETGLALHDPADIADKLKNLTARIEDTFLVASHRSLADHIESFTSYIDRNASGQAQRVPTGYSKLDFVTGGGLEASDLVLVGGQPGTGKTSFAANVSISTLERNIATGFLEGEMTGPQIFTRMNAIYMNKRKDDVRSGVRYGEYTLPFLQWLHNRPFHFVESNDRTKNPQSLRREIERMARAGCQLVIVDYLQCYRERNSKISEYDSVSNLVTMLRGMALRLNIVLFVLASLNRDVDSRTGRATLASFRGSGELEFNAVIALLLHRVSKQEEERGDIRKLELDVKKNREGREGTIKLDFDLETQRITEANND